MTRQDKRAIVNLIDNINAISFYEANEHSKECYYDIRNAILAMPEQELSNDAIFRTRAMETFERWAEFKDYTHVERHILHAVVDELRAMPSIGEQPDEWTPIFKDLYDGMAEGGNHDRME